MNTDRTHYKKYVTARMQKSPLGKDCFRAFWTGGLICAVAQGITVLYRMLGASVEDAGIWTSVTLIFLTALATGIGVFDRIARFAGAGTLVPITGFANSVSACALDTKGEGFVLGVGANMFKIAGPVIVYGTAAGVVYGLIYRAMLLF